MDLKRRRREGIVTEGIKERHREGERIFVLWARGKSPELAIFLLLTRQPEFGPGFHKDQLGNQLQGPGRLLGLIKSWF